MKNAFPPLAGQTIRPAPFTHALVLGANSAVRGMDRSALRLAGVSHTTGLASGAAALDILAGQTDQAVYDLVLCDERLLDMTSLDLLRGLRERDLFGRAPVLVLSPQATRRRVLAAIGAGCAGFLSRPYAVADLEAQLVRARTAFDCAPERMLDYAQQALDSGAPEDTVALEAAESDFNEGAVDCTASAQAAFAEGAEHLLQQNWDTPNPLLRGAADLLRRGDTDTAARVLIEAYALPCPENGLDVRSIARASQLTEAPERTILELCAAVDREGAPDLSKRLRQRLVGNFGESKAKTAALPDWWRDEADAPKPNEFWRHFPLLHDAISVACFTARSLREAA